jgi:NAD(P)-dependent dehydrogenase (short-subunit alcohol dehydrogenase family)
MPKLSPPTYVPPHDLLRGKNVLITAAAGAGIGFAPAKRCAEEGARLFIGDIHEKRTAEAAKTLESISGQPVGHRLCNVREDADVRALITDAITEMGHLDVVINNAGLGGEVPVVDMTDDQWTSVLDITLNSVFRMLPQRSLGNGQQGELPGSITSKRYVPCFVQYAGHQQIRDIHAIAINGYQRHVILR